MIFRDPTCELLSFSMAAFASSSVPISTKPNPLERPVALSMMILALTTFPAGAKMALSSVSVVS